MEHTNSLRRAARPPLTPDPMRMPHLPPMQPQFLSPSHGRLPAFSFAWGLGLYVVYYV